LRPAYKGAKRLLKHFHPSTTCQSAQGKARKRLQIFIIIDIGGFNPKMYACPLKFGEIKATYISNDGFLFEFVANARKYYTMHTFSTSLLFVTDLCFSFFRKN